MLGHGFPLASPLAALAFSLAACAGDDGAPAPVPGAALSLSVELPPGRALRGYAWDEGPVVPWLSSEPPARFPIGELGRTPSTLLYLTFQVAPTVEVEALGPGWTASSRSCSLVEGRFGQGLRLGAGSRLALELPAAARLGRAWTVELWLRPDARRESEVLALPGLLALRCLPDGRLQAELAGEPPVRTVGPGPLAVERWNHVGLVLDPEDTESLRVAVNAEVWSQPLEPERTAEPPRELVVGDVSGAGRGFSGAVDELRLQARAANTAEFEEHAAAGAVRGPRRLRLSFDEGVEELELWPEPFREAWVDSPEDWDHARLEHALARPEGLLRVEGHWRESAAPDRPPARTTHPTVFLRDHQVFLFGGETRDTHLSPMRNTDDTWIFDTVSETWTRLDTPLAPPGRCHQAAAYSPEHDLVLLAGGFRNERGAREIFSDVWVFHVGERRWERRSSSVGPLSDCSVVYHPRARRFVVIRAGRILLYDPAEDRWTDRPRVSVVDSSGRPAEYAPGGSTMTGVDPRTGTIVLFGGEHSGAAERFSEATALYDLDSNRVTLLSPSSSPSPRVRSGFAWDSRGERFVLFGGVQDQRSQRDGDLWSFDPATREWQRLEASNAPSPRGGYYGMAYDPALERFFLLCGRHSFSRFLDEAWSLELSERAPGLATLVFDRSGFAARDWAAACETPGDSGVELRFRTSDDARHWSEWVASDAALAREARYVQVEARLRPGTAGEVPVIRGLGFR